MVIGGKIVSFEVDRVIIDRNVYPLKSFKNGEILGKTMDCLDNVVDKMKLLNVCWGIYSSMAKKAAENHHAGCRYGIKNRAKKDSIYKMYKGILCDIAKLRLEVNFEKNMMI